MRCIGCQNDFTFNDFLNHQCNSNAINLDNFEVLSPIKKTRNKGVGKMNSSSSEKKMDSPNMIFEKAKRHQDSHYMDIDCSTEAGGNMLRSHYGVPVMYGP